MCKNSIINLVISKFNGIARILGGNIFFNIMWTNRKYDHINNIVRWVN